MADYFWAGITISFLAVWGALNSRKSRYLRRNDPNLGRISAGLLLLCGWSGLNFIENLIPIREHAGTSIIIILESLDTAFLLGAGLLTAVSWVMALPNLRNWLVRNKGMESALELGEIISGMSVNHGSKEFLHISAQTLADYLESGFYFISKGKDENGLEHRECYKIDHDSNNDGRHKFIACDASEIEILDDESISRKYKKITMEFCAKDETCGLEFYVPANRRIHLTDEALNYLGGILSVQLQNAMSLETADARINMLDMENRLFALAGRNSDLGSYLKDTFGVISEKFPLDYISVAVIDSTIQNMYRYTYAEVGGSLLERGICYPLKQTAALKVASEKRMLIANTLESDFYRDDYHLYKSGFSSRLVYPLCDDSGRVKGVLTLAAVKPRAFNEIKDRNLNFLNRPFCRMIDMHNVTTMMNTLKKQVVSGFNLTFGLESNDGLGDFYNRSARILAETLPATMCRIWGLNQKNNSLESIGFYSLHNQPDSTLSNREGIGLELMPRHKTAIAMGKAIIVNQSIPEYSMDMSEVKAMGLPGVKSAILAPMRLQNRVFGIISVGELRNWERRSLGQQELLYSQIISTITALVREIDRQGTNINRLKEGFSSLERKAQIYETYPSLPSKLSSSLSSLLGAAQLIRHKLPEDALELIRYNEIILKGAGRLMDEIRKFEEVKNSLT